MSEPNSVQQTTVQPGDVLAGKYRVERVLGSGGMGTVVAAHHLDLDELRAVKLMHPVQVENTQAVERFLREARITARLKSEHIPRLYDVGRLESGAPYIVMEVLEGSDLRTLLKTRGMLPIEEAVLYILQACEAIAEAHAAGIIHRDLKPANLFLTTRKDGSPCIKVLDFGISKLLEPGRAGADMTKTLDVLGSIHYMAPEQLRSSRSVDGRADVWSLGIILYRLLTGRLPFHGDTPVAYIMALRDTFHPPSAFRSDLPQGLVAAVMHCLEKEPEQRTPSVKQLIADLTPFAPSPSKAAQVPAARPSQGSNPGVRVQVTPDVRTLESFTVTQPMSDTEPGASMLRGGTVPIPLAMRAGLVFGKSSSPGPESEAPEVDPEDDARVTPASYKPPNSGFAATQASATAQPAYYDAAVSSVPYAAPDEIDSFTGTAPQTAAGGYIAGASHPYAMPASSVPYAPTPSQTDDLAGLTQTGNQGYYEPSPPASSDSLDLTPGSHEEYPDRASRPDDTTGPLPSEDYDAGPPPAADDDPSAVPEYYAGPPPLQTIPIKAPAAAGVSRPPPRRSSGATSLPVFVLLGCLLGAIAGVIVAIFIVFVRPQPLPEQPPPGPASIQAANPPAPSPSPTPAPAPTPPASAAAVESAAPAPETPPPASAGVEPQPPPTTTVTTAPPAVTIGANPLPTVPRPFPTTRKPPPSKPTSAPTAEPPPPPRTGPIFE